MQLMQWENVSWDTLLLVALVLLCPVSMLLMNRGGRRRNPDRENVRGGDVLRNVRRGDVDAPEGDPPGAESPAASDPSVHESKRASG